MGKGDRVRLMLSMAVAGVALASACGGDECRDVACRGWVEINVRSSASEPVATFDGGVDVGAERIRIDCVDGQRGGTADARIECRVGTVLVALGELIDPQPSLTIELRSAAGEDFLAVDSPTYFEALPTADACDVCLTGQTRVQLR